MQKRKTITVVRSTINTRLFHYADFPAAYILVKEKGDPFNCQRAMYPPVETVTRKSKRKDIELSTRYKYFARHKDRDLVLVLNRLRLSCLECGVAFATNTLELFPWRVEISPSIVIRNRGLYCKPRNSLNQHGLPTSFRRCIFRGDYFKIRIVFGRFGNMLEISPWLRFGAVDLGDRFGQSAHRIRVRRKGSQCSLRPGWFAGRE